MFPGELKRLKNWVGYKSIDDKAPLNPYTGYHASSTDRATWGTYEEAQIACKKFGWAGIGITLESPYIGIDLDDCVTNGIINDFAKRIIHSANTYTEFSPSGTGIHAIGKGNLERALKKPEIEVYQTGRYFTVTEKLVQPLRLLRKINLNFLAPFYRQEIGKSKILTRLQTVQNGSRNNDLFSLASSLRARGYSIEEMYAFLEPKAKEVNFSLEELRLVCNSAGKYPAGNIPKLDGQGENIESFLADQTPVKWICEPFIAEQAIGFIAGLPESRKSWVLIDLAIECARGGGLWLNKFPVKGCKVLLIDQERSKSEVQRRLQAVIAGKGLDVRDISSSLFVRSGTSSRIDLQSSYDALRKEMADLKPDIVLIDSFATFHTKNEGSRMEIQQVMERIKEMRNEFNCAIILIHHETKQAYQNKKDGAESSYLDMAGNVAIPAAAEFCMNVVKHDEESSFCHHTKCTQGKKMAPFLVRVRDLEDDRSEIAVEAF